MFRVGSITVTRYWVYDDLSRGEYHIDIMDFGDYYEAWLKGACSGISELMFGCPKDQSYGELTFDDFVAMVQDNYEDYIKTYQDENI